MPRRENDCCEEANVFDKPSAEAKLVLIMPRREKRLRSKQIQDAIEALETACDNLDEVIDGLGEIV